MNFWIAGAFGALDTRAIRSRHWQTFGSVGGNVSNGVNVS